MLWAKKATTQSECLWLPLAVHMSDAAECGRRLWLSWLPPGIRRQIACGISLGGEPVDNSFAEKVAVFLAAAHDLGKASPLFQAKTSSPPGDLDGMIRRSLADVGLPLKDKYGGGADARHEIVSHGILSRNGIDDSVAVILSGHHGRPPGYEQLNGLKSYRDSCGFKDAGWIQAQDELLRHALGYAGLALDVAASLRISRPAQALLCGLVILSDWIASGTDLFPLVEPETSGADSSRRADAAFRALGLPDRWAPERDWDSLYYRRFGIEEERPVQTAALRIAQMKPGIMVIEAPMGEGKTEAALAAAEILANGAGRGGIYFALPTQATSDAMFTRVLSWIERIGSHGERYSARLSHGKAFLSEEYQSIPLSGGATVDEEGRAVVVHEWLSGRKKGMLNDFVVGTVDHVLMAGLKQKHLVLRHLGLACKVVVIDEAHAYDVYMSSYLDITLKWLGAYGVPVVVLSATLPAARRRSIIDAYLDKAAHTANAKSVPSVPSMPSPPSEPSVPSAKSLAYPLITCTLGDEIRQFEAQGDRRSFEAAIRRIDDHALAGILVTELADGGCAGVIANTVGRAQEMYSMLASQFGNECVRLLHARFLSCDRAEREQDLNRLLGPPGKADRPGKLIVVGTQVLEQSLDLDFDILATDLCPMDLMMQRIGRLHRHSRARPPHLACPACYVMGAGGDGFEHGAEAVYGKYLLMRTLALLPERVTLPGDIPRLVEGVYDEGYGIDMEPGVREVYEAARVKWFEERRKREGKARAFQISPPSCIQKTLIGWLDNSLRDDSEKRGEATVRDGADSVEAIVIWRHGGCLSLLPWIGGGRALPPSVPDGILARELVSSSVRLPALFGGEWIVDKAIGELEDAMAAEGLARCWEKSYLLKGALCLILDGAMETSLCGYRLKYDKDLGLVHQKEA